MIGCKTDWRKCADNADLANNYDGMTEAQIRCKRAATSMAKYGTPEFPWVFYFSSYRPGIDYVPSGIAILIENKAKFQNGFGAMAHVKLICEFDLREKKVVNVTFLE